MIVDAHAHVWAIDPARYPWRPLQSHVAIPETAATADALAAAMTAASVGRAVLVQPSTYGYDHRYLFDAIRSFPDRFTGVCLVDPLAAGAEDRLAALAREPNIRGVRLLAVTTEGEAVLTAGGADRLLAATARLGLTASFLVRPSGITMLDRIAARHPTLRIVIDHLGLPDVSEPTPYPRFRRLLDLAARPNIFVKLSGFYAWSRLPYPHPDCRPFVELALTAFGPRRLAWASDSPYVLSHCTYRDAVDQIRLLLPDLPRSDLDFLMGDTARTLW